MCRYLRIGLRIFRWKRIATLSHMYSLGPANSVMLQRLSPCRARGKDGRIRNLRLKPKIGASCSLAKVMKFPYALEKKASASFSYPENRYASPLRGTGRL